jgi:hypothetical protein
MYIDVSSANSLIEQSTSATMSLIKARNRSGPRIDPWGTPAFIERIFDSLPFNKTFCFREDR